MSETEEVHFIATMGGTYSLPTMSGTMTLFTEGAPNGVSVSFETFERAVDRVLASSGLTVPTFALFKDAERDAARLLWENQGKLPEAEPVVAEDADEPLEPETAGLVLSFEPAEADVIRLAHQALLLWAAIESPSLSRTVVRLCRWVNELSAAEQEELLLDI